MEQPSIPIFLTIGSIPKQILELSQKKGITFINKNDLLENANDASFNESKFMGIVALSIAQGKIIILDNAESFVTKKGSLSLNYHIAVRANNTPVKYILICDNPTDSKIFKCVNEVISIDQFENYNTAISKPDMSKIKVTCGLTGTAGTTSGHITRAFNISFVDSELLKEHNSIYLQKTYLGINIGLTVNGKSGGSVIHIQDLGPTAHITNKTSIKAVLSGPIVEKYNDGVMEFQLKDIDPSAKQDLTIKIEKTEDLQVLVTGWYCYALEVKKN